MERLARRTGLDPSVLRLLTREGPPAPTSSDGVVELLRRAAGAGPAGVVPPGSPERPGRAGRASGTGSATGRAASAPTAERPGRRARAAAGAPRGGTGPVGLGADAPPGPRAPAGCPPPGCPVRTRCRPVRSGDAVDDGLPRSVRGPDERARPGRDPALPGAGWARAAGPEAEPARAGAVGAGVEARPALSVPELERLLDQVLGDAARRHGIEV